MLCDLGGTPSLSGLLLPPLYGTELGKRIHQGPSGFDTPQMPKKGQNEVILTPHPLSILVTLVGSGQGWRVTLRCQPEHGKGASAGQGRRACAQEGPGGSDAPNPASHPLLLSSPCEDCKRGRHAQSSGRQSPEATTQGTCGMCPHPVMALLAERGAISEDKGTTRVLWAGSHVIANHQKTASPLQRGTGSIH